MPNWQHAFGLQMNINGLLAWPCMAAEGTTPQWPPLVPVVRYATRTSEESAEEFAKPRSSFAIVCVYRLAEPLLVKLPDDRLALQKRRSP